LHTWKIERGHNQDLSEQISESKTLGLQVLYCGICCHWGTQKKKTGSECTHRRVTANLQPNLQLREYAKILYIQILQILYWELLNAWLVFVTVVTQKLDN